MSNTETIVFMGAENPKLPPGDIGEKDPTMLLAEGVMSIEQARMKTGSKELTARLIMMLGTGGGGKTTTGQAILSVAFLKGIPVELFDADPANHSVRRYNPDLPSQNSLYGDTAEDMEEFLESQVFSSSGHALVDLGVNKEEAVINWFNDRGSAVADQSAIIVPINKVDGVYTASRIIDNTNVPVLLMLNGSGGRIADAIAVSPEFAALMKKTHGTIVVPDFGRTIHISHATSTPLHVMAKQGNAFDRAGACVRFANSRRSLNLIRCPGSGDRDVAADRSFQEKTRN